MLDLVLGSLDIESLANVYQTNSALQDLVMRYLEIHDYALPGANNALIHAAERGKKHVVQFTLLAGADVHAEDDQALRLASLAGHADVLRVLLNAGADVHALNDEALRLASRHGHADVVQMCTLAMSIHWDRFSARPFRSFSCLTRQAQTCTLTTTKR
jgi:ankyrin repeat protein